MSLLTIRYPDTLPCPQASVIAPAERRQLSDADRPRDARALQRDRLQIERVTFPPMRSAQFAAFRDWWRNDLIYGASWFVADWPTPAGVETAVHRFVSPPSWSFIPGGMFSISAECEVRGRGEDPTRPPQTIFLLHMDGDLFDAVGGGFSNIGPALIEYADSANGFGQQGSFVYSIGLVGQNAASRVYAGDDPLIDVAEWQLEAFVTLTAGTFPARTLVSITRETAAVQTPLVVLQIQSGNTTLRASVRLSDLGFEQLDEESAGSLDLVAGQRTHVRLVYRNRNLRQYHDGVLVVRLDGVDVDTTVASTTQTRVCIGATPAGAGPVFAAFMAGSVDEVRLASEVTDEGEFDTPTRPFTLPY